MDGDYPDFDDDPTSRYVYGPKFSRFLTKAGWSLKYREDQRSYFKVKMLGELHNVHFIPLLSDYV